MMRIISSRLVSSASEASLVNLSGINIVRSGKKRKGKAGCALDHILCDSINLLLAGHVGVCKRVKVYLAVAFEEPRSHSFQLLPVLRGQTVVLRPYEMKHPLDSDLSQGY